MEPPQPGEVQKVQEQVQVQVQVQEQVLVQATLRLQNQHGQRAMVAQRRLW